MNTFLNTGQILICRKTTDGWSEHVVSGDTSNSIKSVFAADVYRDVRVNIVVAYANGEGNLRALAGTKVALPRTNSKVKLRQVRRASSHLDFDTVENAVHMQRAL